MNEHRASPRQRVLKAGTIAFNGDAGISCTVRNLSATGAALDVASPFGIPEQFTLVLEAHHAAKPCRVVWRKERRIGVEFIDQAEFDRGRESRPVVTLDLMRTA
jgi:hypothetical protein